MKWFQFIFQWFSIVDLHAFFLSLLTILPRRIFAQCSVHSRGSTEHTFPLWYFRNKLDRFRWACANIDTGRTIEPASLHPYNIYYFYIKIGIIEGTAYRNIFCSSGKKEHGFWFSAECSFSTCCRRHISYAYLRVSALFVCLFLSSP